jgi:hypothetical protein
MAPADHQCGTAYHLISNAGCAVSLGLKDRFVGPTADLFEVACAFLKRVESHKTAS